MTASARRRIETPSVPEVVVVVSGASVVMSVDVDGASVVVVVEGVVTAQSQNADVAASRRTMQLTLPIKKDEYDPPVHSLPPQVALTSGSSRGTRIASTKSTMQYPAQSVISGLNKLMRSGA